MTPTVSGQQRLQFSSEAHTVLPGGAVVTQMPALALRARVSPRYGRGFARLLFWLMLIGAGFALHAFGEPYLKPLVA
ncbi:hypothetical protein ABTA75_19270, partial [Acinetobacter baumannii]